MKGQLTLWNDDAEAGLVEDDTTSNDVDATGAGLAFEELSDRAPGEKVVMSEDDVSE